MIREHKMAYARTGGSLPALAFLLLLQVLALSLRPTCVFSNGIVPGLV
jgi:hypothetical protein